MKLGVVLLPMLLLTIGGPVPAAEPPPAELAAKTDEPYRITVRLGLGEDPVFTPLLIASLRREVCDQLRQLFGELAQVEVETVAHGVLPADEETDFAAATPLSRAGRGAGGEGGAPHAADAAAEPSSPPPRPSGKQFLFDLAFDGGLYTLCWRQIDADAQYVGPLGQRTTPDRQWLAKAVCLAVRDDFAPVAVVEPSPDGRQAQLRFRGAKWGPRLAAWLPRGGVLLPFWVVRQRDGSLGREPIPNTLLLTDDAEGHTARVVTATADPWRRTARVAGFQAVRVRTQSGRVRLTLVDAADGAAVLDATVQANSRGFDAAGDRDRLPDPDREGVVLSPRPLDGVAYITIRAGGVYQVPLAITADCCPLTCRISRDAGWRAKNDWLRRLRYCTQDVQVLQTVLDGDVREINELSAAKRYEDALAKARATAAALMPLVTAAGETLDGLSGDQAGGQPSQRPVLTWLSRQLDDARQRTVRLQQLADELAAALQQIDAQQRARVLVNLGVQSELAGDVDEAIARYDEASRAVPDDAALRGRLDELKEAWRIKSDEHAAARRFVLERWAKADVRTLAELLPETRRQFESLKVWGDYLTIRKLLKATGDHLRTLAELIDMLAARTDPADRALFDSYSQLTEELAKFQLEVSQWLKLFSRLPSDPPYGKQGNRPTAVEERADGGKGESGRD